MIIEVKRPSLTITIRTETVWNQVLVEYEYGFHFDPFGFPVYDKAMFTSNVYVCPDGSVFVAESPHHLKRYGDEKLLAIDFIPQQVGLTRKEFLTFLTEVFARGVGVYHYLVVVGD
jgi:hypothetical protein